MNDKNSGLNFRRFLKTNITEFFRNFLSCNEIVGREGRYDRRLGISGKRGWRPGISRISVPSYLGNSGPIHNTPEESENGGFTLKTNQMLSVHSTPEKIYRNAKIYGHSGFVFVEISVREIKWLSWSHRKLRFQNVLRPHWNKTRSRRFQIPPVWRAFWKLTLSFRDRLVWTVGLTVEMKLVFKFLRRSEDAPRQYTQQ